MNPSVAFTDTLQDHLKQLANGLLEAAEKDTERYAEAMAVDLAAATLLGDQEGIDEILAQARALGEKYRVRGNDAMWSLFIESVGGTVGVVSMALRVAQGLL